MSEWANTDARIAAGTRLKTMETKALGKGRIPCIPTRARIAALEKPRAAARDNPTASIWALLGSEATDDRLENQVPVGAAKDRFATSFRVRHHAQHVARFIDDAGNVVG